MRVKYFEDTDTLYMQLSEVEPAETRELNPNVLLELDKSGKGSRHYYRARKRSVWQIRLFL